MKSVGDTSTGVLLVNLGGPDSIDAVRPFLFNLFSDRDIIRLGPAFLQKPLAYLISILRHRKTESFYRLIGGRSPIGELTELQARALEEALNSSVSRFSDRTDSPPSSSFSKGGMGEFKVYFGMRYWHPLLENVVPEISRDGIRRLIVLSLYPQYSVATTGSSLAKFKEAAAGLPITIFYISSWFDNALYIDALVDAIRRGIGLFRSSSPDVRVLFSAHSLPVKFIDEGDPYLEQIRGTIKEITRKIDITWDLSFQSRSGPVRWLEPSTDDMIKELAVKGIKNLLVVPISFVSDHIETLYEIDIVYKEMAGRLGMRLERMQSLNTSPLFISALKDIVLKGMKEARWT